MTDTEPFFKLPIPEKTIVKQSKSEQIGADHPMALEVAEPFFSAGGRIAAITERLNYHTAPDTEVSRRHVHAFTLLLQGELTMIVGDKEQIVTSGQLVYNPPEARVRRMGRPSQGVWFLYMELYDIPQWEALKSLGPFVRDYEYADQMFLLLRRILDSRRTRRNIELSRANSVCLVELIRQIGNIHSNLPDRRLTGLRGLVEEISLHPEYPWNTSEMAKSLHMSRATLTRLFRAEYSVPPKMMVIKQRIAKAIELFRETNYTIETIAPMVGYESVATFSNLFKKNIGMRPGDFRKKYRGNSPYSKDAS